MTLAGALLALVSFQQIHATVLYSTGFEEPDYEVGNLSGQNSWVGSSSFDVVSGGLDYSSGTVDSNGGSQKMATDVTLVNSDNVTHVFSAQTGDVYFSYLFNWAWTQTPSVGETGWLYFKSVNSNTNSSMGVAGVSQGQGFLGRIVTSGGAYNNSSLASGSMLNGVTGMVVGKISKSSPTGNYDTLEFIVNPTDGSEPTSWAYTISADSGISTIDRLIFRVLSSDTTGDTLALDNLVVGTEYADVVIPEPSSSWMLLAVFPAFALLIYRKRKQRS